MQLGFVIDHTRCIGCHACTVACKSENDVPVGSFRTWVKYTEEGSYPSDAGSFPSVKRSFAVLRCNQCSDAPCVTICPVSALEKRTKDGIVDIDPSICIGCKACMHACPYDALYINDDTGTAEKCHFCAHRTEVGLAPACAVVCPTEAIIPGDFHDPNSMVSLLRKEHDLVARKPEAGTSPNVLYREVGPAGVDPTATSSAGGFLWADVPDGPQREAGTILSADGGDLAPKARTVYDVGHATLWGAKIVAYLVLKALAAGLLLAGATMLPPLARPELCPPIVAIGLPALALAFLVATSIALVADLKRPDRFYLILIRPNMKSWLARGTFVLIGYGALLSVWLALGITGIHLTRGPLGFTLLGATLVLAWLSAAYTGFLFSQARGRILWVREGLWVQLTVKAALAGAGALLIAHRLLELPEETAGPVRTILLGALAIHAWLIVFERTLAPKGREREFKQAMKVAHHGADGIRRWVVSIGLCTVGALGCLAVPGTAEVAGTFWAMGGALALLGLVVEEEHLIRAGQATPLS